MMCLDHFYCCVSILSHLTSDQKIYAAANFFLTEEKKLTHKTGTFGKESEV